jgi:diguanylate cyclase (GGDEF)-like protein/PAS domain S-box-containing protein
VRPGARAEPPAVELQQQVQFLQALIQHSADMVSVVATDGTLRFHYPPSVLGYADGENFGRSVFEFVHPDDVEAAQQRFAAAMAVPGATEGLECRVRTADGQWRWLEIATTNLLDDPTIRGLVLNARDVSERKHAEQSLQRSTERFRLLVQHASELTLVWGAGGEITYATPATIRFASGPERPDRSDVDVRSVVTVVHPDDRDRVDSLARALGRRDSASESFVARFLRYDGAYRWLEVTLTNQLSNPGIQGMVANARDITDKLEAESALLKTEKRYAALVQHSSDIIAVVDSLGTMLYHSPATERLLGYPEGSLTGTNAFTLCHRDDLDAGLATLAETLARPDVPARVELRIQHGDGTWRNMAIAASNRLADPAVEGIVLNVHDVTARRRAEQAQRANDAWFRSLVQHGYDIVAVVDPDARVQYVSPSIVHILGYDPDQVVDRIGFDFVHPSDVLTLASHFEAALASTTYHTPVEVRGRHADGSWRWFEVGYTNQLDDPIVAGVVVNFREVTERKRVEGELAHQALHDSLTGLPNRVLLVDRLDQALARAARGGGRVGALFLDIDRFKLVNDTRGHAVGDELLVSVAGRLREASRGSDTVARFGGDEFVVIYDDIADDSALLALGKRLCDALSHPFRLGEIALYASVSVGAALGQRDESAETLLRDADAAMYHAKEQGGNSVALVDEEIRQRVHARFDTERSLHGALDRDEFALVYQPIVALDTGRVVSFEALLRWDHPERGRLGPGEFIDLAEETGQIVPIGAHTLQRACEQLVEWRGQVPGRDLTMSVNVSAAQLRDPELPELVGRTLQQAGLAPEALTLEITESFLIDDTRRSVDTLAALKALGLRLVVDDFGVRYSSLGYLNRMPVDGLKIDRMFVRGLASEGHDPAIVVAIMAMADALGLSVIAEGVETEAQNCRIWELGGRFAQGFLYARPLAPAAAFELACREPRAAPVYRAQLQRPPGRGSVPRT